MLLSHSMLAVLQYVVLIFSYDTGIVPFLIIDSFPLFFPIYVSSILHHLPGIKEWKNEGYIARN